MENKLICWACNKELVKPCYFGGLNVCSSCFNIIQTPFQNQKASEMRLLGNFLIFWAGLKYNEEVKAMARTKRKERKLEKQWH